MLHWLVRAAAERFPDACAVVAPDGDVTYAQLDARADQLALALADLGVRPRDRVGIWLDKSVAAIVAMQAALRLGAAYVPVDPQSPRSRAAKLLADCTPLVVVTSPERAESLVGLGVEARLYTGSTAPEARPLPEPATTEDDLAYILYTSGSTGDPKGVCLSHRNALAFVEWAAGELRAAPADRFANHAPLHFDLSVLDLYVAFWAGACVHVVPQEMSYRAKQLVWFLVDREITVWYSVPAALLLMMRHGGWLETGFPALRALLFAGEPFPVAPLRELREHLPDVRLLNLYGPTETNVCTCYEVHNIPAEQTVPVPIGTACCGNTVWAVLPDGRTARAGEEGELVVSGPTVMVGYWGRPPQAGRPYPTGDLALVLEDGGFQFVGRRDAMVKVRGQRVELGEIEAVLHDHPRVSEAAVVVAGHSIDARIVAFLVPAEGHYPSLLDIKQYCAERLPRYSIVDSVRHLPALPRTGNGKIDRRSLDVLASEQE